jgi:hypothetical protein
VIVDGSREQSGIIIGDGSEKARLEYNLKIKKKIENPNHINKTNV